MTEMDALRDAILDAALPNVPFDGWSMATLRQGAADAGHDATALLQAFPDGVPQAIAHFVAAADRRMLAALEDMDLESMRVRDRVTAGVRLRLEQAAPHKEAVRKALAFLAMPQNAGLSLKTLHRTVDAIWTAAGDTSTDINYYTKRALLAGVYSATVLYWLDDRSDGHAATWAFLDRRIENVMTVGKATGKFAKAAGRLPFPDPMSVARRVRDGFAEGRARFDAATGRGGARDADLDPGMPGAPVAVDVPPTRH